MATPSGSKVLQLGQAPLQVSYVAVAVVAPVAAGAALQELHLHLQLAELKVPALLPQVHAAAHGTVLRAEGRRAGHPQRVPKRGHKTLIRIPHIEKSDVFLD